MKNLWSLACSSAVALGLVGLMAAPSVAAPLAPLDLPVKAGVSTNVVPVSDHYRIRRDRAEWRDYRRHRRHHRRHYRRHRPSIYFNFSVPTYRYVEPRYVPRYRYGLSAAHVRWCYDRYRSYRAYDNTFQPYHGPRQQCWSPYS